MSQASGEIPVIDVEDLRQGASTERRAAAVAAIRLGFGKFGLLYLRGAAVTPFGPLYDRFDAFTSRPRADKERFNRPDIWYQRGWTPPNTEIAVASTGQPDFKECWFAAPVPMDPVAVTNFPETHCANIWPDGADASEFAERYERLGGELQAAGIVVLEAAAEALGLPRDAFTSRAAGGPHVLRLLKYLPLTEAQVASGVLWGEEHTDFNLITLLPGGRFQDPAGAVAASPDPASGLYLRTRPTEAAPAGERVKGTAPPGCLVVQVGQQLEILTGGTFLATPHVVTAPSTPGWSRLSAAHFVHLHAHTFLFPLEPFRTAASVEAYRPPVLAGTYALKTLVDIGLAPRSAIESLGYRHYDRLADARASEAAR